MKPAFGNQKKKWVSEPLMLTTETESNIPMRNKHKVQTLGFEAEPSTKLNR